jgi:DnaJ-class molecular chaperone
MEINDALNVFGMKKIPTINEVLEECKKLYEIDKLRDEFCNARNCIVKHLVVQQMTERRYFEIPEVDGVCNKCHGTGELYHFHKKQINVKCNSCNGEGTKVVKCNRCEDGRYIRKMNNGGVIINVQCNRCHGEGTVTVKCQLCLGKGTVKKAVTSEHMKSFNSCPECKGKGFKKEIIPEPPPLKTEKEIVEKEVERLIKKEQNPMNPVIDPEKWDKLMARIPAA